MPVDPLKARALLREYGRRRKSRDALAAELADPVSSKPGPSLRSLMRDSHPRQAKAINDPARLVAVLGTRRSGKSRGWLRRMVFDAATTPKSYQVYINTSWPECRRIAWRGAGGVDGLQPLNDRFGLGAVFHKADRTMTFPNGSVIECIPADDSRSIARALGTALHRCWIDEAQKMPQLDYAVKQVLGPTMTDFDGQIVLTGTPSRDCSGLFYEITKEGSELDGWAVHKLNVLDNPFFGKTRKARYERTIKAHCVRFGLSEDSPEVRREWFGEWVEEDANFVYHVHRVSPETLFYAPARYSPGRLPDHEGLGGVPDLHAALRDLPVTEDDRPYQWYFGIGLDLGYEPDPFAYVLWAWSPALPGIYEVMSWKQVRLIPDEQAAIISDLHAVVPFTFAGADAGGGGKGVVRGWSEGWLNRYPLPIEEAPKAQKVTAIEFMNNDIRTGHMKLREGGVLYEEMKRLTWAPRKAFSMLREDVGRDRHGKKRRPNDCCDAGLYGHRMAHHFRYQPVAPEPIYGTPEYWEHEEARMEADAIGLVEDSRYEFFYN